MNANSAEPINLALRDHQSNVDDWDFHKLTADLHVWVAQMILDFKLQTQGTPALMVERLRKHLGHYRIGRNGFGLNDEIALDEHYVRVSPYWEVLGTLAHEILHLWQHHSGNPPGLNSHNYHNREFRRRAEELGLIVDQYGRTQYAPGDTPFMNLLRKYGVQAPAIPKPHFPLRKKCSSTLNLYECLCGVKVRVGRSRFNAKCLDCNGLFKRRGRQCKDKDYSNDT
jgi:hypothetical protein